MARPAAQSPWTVAWSQPIDSTDALQIATTRAFVFVAGPDTGLEARTTTTGDVAWRLPTASWTALAAADDLVLGVSGEHALALDAATGRTRWVTQTTGPQTRLAVDGRHVLMISDTDLLLRDISTGSGVWRAALAGPLSAPPAFEAGTVTVAQQDGTITQFDRATGAVRWSRRLTRGPIALASRSPMVYAGLADGAFCALSSRDGGEQWCFPLRVPVVGAPSVDQDVVRVALLDNSLRSLDRLNGAMQQPQPLGHRPATGPWLTGTSVIVALTTGEFVVIDRGSGATVARLAVPDADARHSLQRAAGSPDSGVLAALTIAPGGARRLTVYRRTGSVLPLTTDLPLPGDPGVESLNPPPFEGDPRSVVPDGTVEEPPAVERPVSPADEPGPSPRPFPTPR